MTDSSRIDVAVVGCGQIADAHLQEIKKLRLARPVAVCDRHRDLARQAAERFGVSRIYDDVGRMLAEVRPDVVHITTPPQTHASLARQVLEAGAHVYVEKPFAVNSVEAEEVFEAARISGKKVCVGHDHLFDPCWLECRRRFESGELGQIVHIDSVMGYDLSGPFGRVMFNEPGHWIHQLPGGLFQNNISHALYKVTDLIPDFRPQVWATWFGQQDRVGPPTELRVFLRSDQATSSILFTSAARPVQRPVRIYGTRRYLEVDFDGRVVRVRNPVGAPGPFAKLAIPWNDVKSSSKSLVRNVWRFLRSDLQYFAGMNKLFELFYLAILRQTEAPIPVHEIRRVTQIMDDIFDACRNTRVDQEKLNPASLSSVSHSLVDREQIQ